MIVKVEMNFDLNIPKDIKNKELFPTKTSVNLDFLKNIFIEMIEEEITDDEYFKLLDCSVKMEE